MENKVGDNVPTAEVMAGLAEQLRTVVDQMKTFGITLSTEDRKRLLHARREADPMVQRVHDLGVKYGVNVKDMPLTSMMNDRTLRARMHPLADLFRSGLVIAEDTEGEAESEMWEAFLAYYGVLANMAQRTPELAVELGPVRDFMANGKRRAPKAGGAEVKAGGAEVKAGGAEVKAGGAEAK